MNIYTKIITISTLIVIFIVVGMLTKISKINVRGFLAKSTNKIAISINRRLKYKDRNRDREERIYNKKSKIYKIVNDIRVDLGIAQLGITNTQLLILICIAALLISIVVFDFIISNLFLTALATPVMIVMIFAILYWKSNTNHDARIEAILDAENIVCNNIDMGVVEAVSSNISQISNIVRPEFEEFVDRVKNRNTHVRVALEMLGKELGSTSDDFIKKCISAETNMQKGYNKSFADFVSMNGMIKDIRNEEKRAFEKIKTSFLISLVMIVVFLAGVIIIYDNVRNFYFKNSFGQFIILLDVLLVTIEITYISYLRAKEL